MSCSNMMDDTKTMVSHELEPDSVGQDALDGSDRNAPPEGDTAVANPAFVSDANGCVLNGTKTQTLTTPVYYSTLYGVQMVRTQAVETQQDGSTVIRTPNPAEISAGQPRPLRPRDIRFVFIFSIVCVFLFIPTGFPALIVAFKCQQDFQKAVQSGNMDKARKRFKLCERLILISVVLGLLSYALVFAIVERHRFGNHDHRTTLHWIH